MSPGAPLRLVAQAIIQMDQATQQNAALVEQAASTSAALQEQAGALADAVSVFEIGGRNGGTLAMRRGRAHALALPA